MERSLGELTVEVWQGDITTLSVDAIVNAANNQFYMGGGVAGAIKRQGGVEIEREAVKKGPVEVGQAVATAAGKLDADYVIHAAVMGMDFVTSAEAISQATANTLKLAHDLGVKSIAFPALGTGVGRFPLEEAAQLMIGEVAKFAQDPGSIEKVVFALFNEEAGAAFQAELERRED